MLILLLLQPLPAVAMTPRSESEAAVRVDLIVVNQCCWMTESEDGYDNRVDFYTSFYCVHYLPPYGMARVPVLEHRGWVKTGPVVRCQDGWAADCNGKLIVAPHLIYLVSPYDWEYRNRDFFRPICP